MTAAPLTMKTAHVPGKPASISFARPSPYGRASSDHTRTMAGRQTATSVKIVPHPAQSSTTGNTKSSIIQAKHESPPLPNAPDNRFLYAALTAVGPHPAIAYNDTPIANEDER